MFTQIEALDKNRHIDLRFNPADNFAFAAGLSMVPLVPSEIIAASRHYPIVFPAKGDPVPQALLSFEAGANAYVDDQGRWAASCIPAQVRAYPFLLARSKTQDETSLVVCIDRDAPHFKAPQGDPLYTANGEPSRFLQQVMDILWSNYEGLQQSRLLGNALDEQGLFTDQLTVSHGGRQTVINGLRVVDRARLLELSPELLGDWNRRGLLELAYLHLHSLDNLARLLQGRSQAQDPYKVIENFQ